MGSVGMESPLITASPASREAFLCFIVGKLRGFVRDIGVTQAGRGRLLAIPGMKSNDLIIDWVEIHLYILRKEQKSGCTAF